MHYQRQPLNKSAYRYLQILSILCGIQDFDSGPSFNIRFQNVFRQAYSISPVQIFIETAFCDSNANTSIVIHERILTRTIFQVIEPVIGLRCPFYLLDKICFGCDAMDIAGLFKLNGRTYIWFECHCVIFIPGSYDEFNQRAYFTYSRPCLRKKWRNSLLVIDRIQWT